MQNNKITKQKIEKYLKLTEKALSKAKKNIAKTKKQQALEIINMAENYFSDAQYFFKDKKDFVNAFAAINYAHGWLDAGVRLGIFNVKDNKLFTIK